MKRKNAGFSWSGALLFFVSNTITVTLSMFLFSFTDAQTNGNKWVIAIVILLAILFLSVAWTIVDIFRRRKMNDQPTEKILEATERIAAGDFSTRILITRKYKYYNQYDYIAENLNIMAAELQKSKMLNSDFVSNVSHELKTPLTVIRSYAQLLQEEKDEEKRIKYAQALMDAVSRMSQLVTSILQLNKLENQKIIPEKKVFRLDEALAEAVLGYEELLERKEIELDCDFEEISVLSSQSYLDLVWNNLLSNAVKFTDRGGKITVKLKRDGKNVVVSVKDTGCGISPETGARIFDKFYQGDTSHSGEGNGLGLALVKKVIQILGGEISVASELGKGSTFRVVLKDAIV
ncbi:MAG: HAMP domain-containing histidine kinase [Clostridia bacterium]|nr:HAMP domain-containing histidine kinase [Clostridia bacterium]